MWQSEKIKYMLTTELTEDELKNVIYYSFSNRPIDTKLWSELLDKLDLTDEDITTDFHDKIKNLVYDAFIIKRIDYDEVSYNLWKFISIALYPLSLISIVRSLYQ